MNDPGAPHRFRRFVGLTVTLAVTDFRLSYYGSVFGYFWTLAKPLLQFAVLYFALTEVLRFGEGIPHFAVYLITAIVLFTYFGETTSQAVGSLVAHEGLIRKIPVPLLAIPFSVALRSAFTLGLNLVAVFFFFFLSGIEPRQDWLQLPLLIGALMLMSTAFASLLANLYVPFRDTGQIWEVAGQLFFWMTPIVYTIENVPEDLRGPMMVNPLAVIMTQMRHALIDPAAPSAASAIGGWERLLIPAAIVLAILVLSAWMHRITAPRLAEQL